MYINLDLDYIVKRINVNLGRRSECRARELVHTENRKRYFPEIASNSAPVTSTSRMSSTVPPYPFAAAPNFKNNLQGFFLRSVTFLNETRERTERVEREFYRFFFIIISCINCLFSIAILIIIGNN